MPSFNAQSLFGHFATIRMSTKYCAKLIFVATFRLITSQNITELRNGSPLVKAVLVLKRVPMITFKTNPMTKN